MVKAQAKNTSGPDTRSRIVATAADLYWRHGLRGIGLQQILAASSAPKGSLYFHFPHGKDQLALEALGKAGDVVTRSLRRALIEDPATGDAVAAFTMAFAEKFAESDFELGCPLATATLEADGSQSQIRSMAAETFTTWQTDIAAHLAARGYSAAPADRLASFAISGIEGALIVARATRSRDPLDTAAEMLRTLLNTQPSPGGC